MPFLLRDKPFITVFSIILVAVLIDTSLAKFSNFAYGQSLSQVNLIIFVLFVIAYIVGQGFILEFIRSRVNVISLSFQSHLRLILKLLSIVQYVSVAVFLVIVFQMILTQGYDPLLIKALVWISYLQATLLTAFLSYKFFSWLALHKTYAIFLYGLAIASLSANTLLSVLHVNELIGDYSSYVRPSLAAGSYLPYVNPSSALTSAFQISSILSYVLMWFVTVILLRSHSRKLGNIRYWSTVSMPLIYFIIQFIPVVLQVFVAYRISIPVTFGIVYTLFFTMSKPIGGFLFAIAFWSTGKSVENPHVRDFMLISGYGIILFFSSNQVIILDNFHYPPFGLVTISFIGIASFLLLIGIYSSALSIAHDATLRSSIRRSVEESGLLDKIGTSEMESYIQRNVVDLTNKLSNRMEEQSGVESSLNEKDIKDYVQEVLREIKKKDTYHL
jgi:hypothetical protein